MVIEDPEKFEIPAIEEELKDCNNVFDRSLPEKAGVKVDGDVSKVDIPIEEVVVVGDPAEDESIGPDPTRENDVESGMEDVIVEDVIETERLREESE